MSSCITIPFSTLDYKFYLPVIIYLLSSLIYNFINMSQSKVYVCVYESHIVVFSFNGESLRDST